MKVLPNPKGESAFRTLPPGIEFAQARLNTPSLAQTVRSALQVIVADSCSKRTAHKLMKGKDTLLSFYPLLVCSLIPPQCS